ncbi:MAG: galactose mutarotase [Oscillospiraceae bacterium]|nr:galactose mutarotase [Oscillospiraceae bacterium]
MDIQRKEFGLLSDGRAVDLFTIKAGELSLSISTLGATWTSLTVPSAKGVSDDILLGYSGFNDYLHNSNYFGVTVGRYANRINTASFCIGGKTYHISENKPGYSLHGGQMGFPRRLWSGEAFESADGVYVRLNIESPDGDQGYPGNLSATVTYGLTKDNRLTAEYEATVDCPCPISLTNHAYFNLAGENRGKSILSHQMQLFSHTYVEIDQQLLPTGRIIDTVGTPLDFSQAKEIGQDIQQLNDTRLGGYDHSFIVDGPEDVLRPFVTLYELESGRHMYGFTTMPAVQVYTGNMLSSVDGKLGSKYERNHGLCLETQHLPDAPNQPSFPCAIYGPDRPYHHITSFSFEW